MAVGVKSIRKPFISDATHVAANFKLRKCLASQVHVNILFRRVMLLSLNTLCSKFSNKYVWAL